MAKYTTSKQGGHASSSVYALWLFRIKSGAQVWAPLALAYTNTYTEVSGLQWLIIANSFIQRTNKTTGHCAY